MANVTAEIQLGGFDQEGRRFHVPVKTGQAVYYGQMVAQQIADGLLVPATVAGAGPVIGKSVQTIASAAAGERCMVETDRSYALTNGLTTDAFSEASLLGAPVYALDDHTAADNDNAGVLQQCGTYEGMEADGKVRVYISASAVAARALGSLGIQRGTGTLASGVLAVTGVTLTATSVIICNRKTEAGTDGDEIRVPTADRTAGALGTGSFTARAFLSGVAATSDTSTFDWLIVG
jgi:hypothetical protein